VNDVPIVLLHGYWHGSWCWSLVTPELAALGRRSVAVDLAGHGLAQRSPASRWGRPFDPGAYATEPSPAAGVTGAGAAEDLVALLRTIGQGRPCALVAHSMGGVVATIAAELAPELVDVLVYVAAFVPVAGLPVAAYLGREENAGSLVAASLAADPAQVGALRYDTGDASAHELVARTFYGDVDPVTASAAIAMLGPDAPAGFVAAEVTATPQRWGSVPHTYVLCRDDRAVDPRLQRLFVGEMDAVATEPTRVVELDSSHSPFLSRPGELAAIIDRASRPAPS
jgi:pimeloyl-ACP methyl ester carboxylesterase